MKIPKKLLNTLNLLFPKCETVRFFSNCHFIVLFIIAWYLIAKALRANLFSGS